MKLKLNKNTWSSALEDKINVELLLDVATKELYQKWQRQKPLDEKDAK